MRVSCRNRMKESHNCKGGNDWPHGKNNIWKNTMAVKIPSGLFFCFTPVKHGQGNVFVLVA